MSCEATPERTADRLLGLLEEGAEAELALHLRSCTDCRRAAGELEELWRRLEIPPGEVPSDRLRARFYAALAAQRQARAGRPGSAELLGRWAVAWWPRQPRLAVGWTAVALVLGVAFGWQGERLSGRGQLHSLRGEVASLSRVVSLSLLEHRQASERLRGVLLADRTTADEEITTALLDTLRGDSNVNVRLAAVEVLAGLVERPEVRSGLIASLPDQASPLLQLAVAEVVPAPLDARDRAVVERVLDDPELTTAVRARLASLAAGSI